MLITTLFSLSLFGSKEPESNNSSEEVPNSKVKEDDSTKTAYEPLNQDDVGEAVANDKKNNAFWIAGLSLTGLVSVIAAIISSKLKKIEAEFEAKKKAAWEKHYWACEKFPGFKKFMLQQIEDENYYMERKSTRDDVMFKNWIGQPHYGTLDTDSTSAIIRFINDFSPKNGSGNTSVAQNSDSDIVRNKLQDALLQYLKNNETDFIDFEFRTNSSKTERSVELIKQDIQEKNANFVYKIVSAYVHPMVNDAAINMLNSYNFDQYLHTLYLELKQATERDANARYENELAQLNKECEAEKAKVWSLSFSSKKSVKYE